MQNKSNFQMRDGLIKEDRYNFRDYFILISGDRQIVLFFIYRFELLYKALYGTLMRY